jgi:small subunit ribosomal protein S20
MPITKGAKKALRVSARKRVFNLRRKSEMKDAMKSLSKAVIAKDKNKAQDLIPRVYKAIDKAAKRGVIKRNTASRKKRRVSALVKNI